MAKILLVEDDVALRDVYSARLQAEGYWIVTASNGEEALASAVKDMPDLILLDVMMPRISGFDVLDIIRSTPETAHSKVIMMTALSSTEDRARGEKLGVDKYLVKSQVTLEEAVAAIAEVLGSKSGAEAGAHAEPLMGAPKAAAESTPTDGATPPADQTPPTA